MSRRLVLRAEVVNQPGYGFAKEKWLVRLNGERKLAFYKASGRILIDLDDLDALIEAGRVEPRALLRSL